jgi:predicted nuclease of predicted toxin-antitoxin system
VRLLLDEMISATVAEQLRARGHDVVAVQDERLAHLRGIEDRVLLAHAADERRGVVTDNVPDFFRCHQARLDAGDTHYGLLFFTNDTFARHRHELFVSEILAALEDELTSRPYDDNSAWITWLSRPS